MAKEVELEKDLTELKQLRSSASRARVQQLLDTEISSVGKQLQDAKLKSNCATSPSSKSGASVSSQNYPVKKLTTFAFDESDKFVKLYYTLAGVQNLPADSINSSFTETSFNVYIKNLNGIDYELGARDFMSNVDPEKSVVKQKSDMVLVMLKKAQEGVKWEKLLLLEKKPPVEMPKFDDDADPQAGLMKMMKKMYDEGDDELKRTIKKSFYESNQKKAGGDGNFDL